MSTPTREVELKARVDDPDAAKLAIQAARAHLVFEGSLRDRLYDTSARSVSRSDNVLRVRTYEPRAGKVQAHLDWKGPTSRVDGFKVRAELTTGITEPAALEQILERLGYRSVGAVDREITQYELLTSDGAVMVRFEVYPRMDTLVEVEGAPQGIEQAIRALDIPRERFSAARLAEFVREFEARTGLRSATSQDALNRD